MISQILIKPLFSLKTTSFGDKTSIQIFRFLKKKKSDHISLPEKVLEPTQFMTCLGLFFFIFIKMLLIVASKCPGMNLAANHFVRSCRGLVEYV